jgi:hypothetical protein
MMLQSALIGAPGKMEWVASTMIRETAPGSDQRNVWQRSKAKNSVVDDIHQGGGRNLLQIFQKKDEFEVFPSSRTLTART